MNNTIEYDKGELQKMFEEFKKRADDFQEENDKINKKIDQIQTDVKRLITMIEPVHSHAEWVDGLRARLHSIGLMRNTPRIESQE
jgi:archaellum component FlaC